MENSDYVFPDCDDIFDRFYYKLWIMVSRIVTIFPIDSIIIFGLWFPEWRRYFPIISIDLIIIFGLWFPECGRYSSIVFEIDFVVPRMAMRFYDRVTIDFGLRRFRLDF